MGRTCACCKTGAHVGCTKPTTCRCDLCYPERASRDAELKTRERAEYRAQAREAPSNVVDVEPDIPKPDPPVSPSAASVPVDARPDTPSTVVEPEKPVAARNTARPRENKGGRPVEPRRAQPTRRVRRVSPARVARRKYDIPEDIREGRQSYKAARNAGRQPNLWEVDCYREYERLRWAQLTPIERAQETDRNNGTRMRRLHGGGKPYERTIRFPGGGSVTLAVNRELHELSDDDRNFFLDFVGHLANYAADMRRRDGQVP